MMDNWTAALCSQCKQPSSQRVSRNGGHEMLCYSCDRLRYPTPMDERIRNDESIALHSLVPNAELEALRSDLVEALSLLRCASSNWKPGCCHQPEWDERRAALLAKHKETK